MSSVARMPELWYIGFGKEQHFLKSRLRQRVQNACSRTLQRDLWLEVSLPYHGSSTCRGWHAFLLCRNDDDGAGRAQHVRGGVGCGSGTELKNTNNSADVCRQMKSIKSSSMKIETWSNALKFLNILRKLDSSAHAHTMRNCCSLSIGKVHVFQQIACHLYVFSFLVLSCIYTNWLSVLFIQIVLMRGFNPNTHAILTRSFIYVYPPTMVSPTRLKDCGFSMANSRRHIW